MDITFNLGCYTEKARSIIGLACAVMHRRFMASPVDNSIKPKRFSIRDIIGTEILNKGVDYPVLELSQCLARRRLDNEVKLMVTKPGPYRSNSWHKRTAEDAKKALTKVLLLMSSLMSSYFGEKPVYFYLDEENTLLTYVANCWCKPDYIYDSDTILDTKPFSAAEIEKVVADLEHPSYEGREDDQFIIEQKRVLMEQVAETTKKMVPLVPYTEADVPHELYRALVDPRLKLESPMILLSRKYE